MKSLVDHFRSERAAFFTINLSISDKDKDVESIGKPVLFNASSCYMIRNAGNLYTVRKSVNYCVDFFKKRHAFLMMLSEKLWGKICEFESSIDCCQGK